MLLPPALFILYNAYKTSYVTLHSIPNTLPSGGLGWVLWVSLHQMCHPLVPVAGQQVDYRQLYHRVAAGLLAH